MIIKSNNFIAMPALIFLLALMMRLIFVISSSVLSFHGALTPSDASVYNDFAVSISTGKGFVNPDGTPASLRPPLYPLFLAGIYLFGQANNFVLVQIIQAILSSLSCVLIYLIAKNYFNNSVALLSSVFSSIYLTSIVVSTFLLTETLFIFILLLAVYLLIKSAESFGIRALAGILFGLLILIKPQMVIFPIAIFFTALILNFKDIKRNCRTFLPILLIPFFVVLPWTLRNYMVFKKFLFTSTEGGITFYHAYHPHHGKIFGQVGSGDGVTRKAKLIRSEIDRDRFLYKEALKSIVANPALVIKLIPLKLAYFFSPFDWEILTGKEFNYLFIFCLPFAIIGMFYLRRRFKELWLLYLTISFFVVLSALFFGAARYRLPIDFFLFIFASFMINGLLVNKTKKLFYSILIFSWFSVNFYAYLNTDFTKEILKRGAQGIRIW